MQPRAQTPLWEGSLLSCCHTRHAQCCCFETDCPLVCAGAELFLSYGEGFWGFQQDWNDRLKEDAQLLEVSNAIQGGCLSKSRLLPALVQLALCTEACASKLLPACSVTQQSRRRPCDIRLTQLS